MHITLADARKVMGWTQRELVERVGVAHSTISMYELGKRDPSASQFKKLAEVLDVSMDDLVLKSK